MDSLPEQHIDDLPAATREEAYGKVAQVLIRRRRGNESEAEVADKAGFGSADAMHHQLAAWGFGGLLPPRREQPIQKPEPRKMPPERKGRGSGGEAEELPAAAGAIELFEAAIDRLKSDLAYVTYLEEALQEDRRFVHTLYYPKEAGMYPDVYLRDEISAERWKELCSEQVRTPVLTDTLYVPADRRFVAGASPFPAMQLVRLIAAYLLCARTWGEVEVLLERLHPTSREPSRGQIRRYLTGATTGRTRDDALQPYARRLARLVRGGDVKRGQDPGGLDSADHTVARHIRNERQKGTPEEDIRRVLRDEYKVPEDDISRLWDIFPPRNPA